MADTAAVRKKKRPEVDVEDPKRLDVIDGGQSPTQGAGSEERQAFDAAAGAPDAEGAEYEAWLTQLDTLGMEVSKLRFEAITAREQSGIEEQWIEDEEYYEGIDDGNRHERRSTWRTKAYAEGKAVAKPSGVRSTAFINITRPYVDAAKARVVDMVEPSDDRAWEFEPTVKPDLEPLLTSARIIKFGDGSQENEADLARAELDEARERAESAEKRVQDWHQESQFNPQVRRAIFDAARIGTGILKGPFPMARRKVTWEKDPRTKIIRMKIVEKIVPGSMAISPHNFYPAPDCGENVHNGSYVFERDYISSKKLRGLKGKMGYLTEQIQRCLDEGPQAPQLNLQDLMERYPDQHKQKFQIWYFTGELKREECELCRMDMTDVPEDAEYVSVQVTMVNHRVIRVVPNPLDTGEFPYDVICWQRVPGSWAGRGVGNQIRTPQRMLVAAIRNMMDNAGLAAGPIIVINRKLIVPADGNWNLTPRKIFWTTDEGAEANSDLTKAFLFFEIPIRVTDLEHIIRIALEQAEEASGLPMILQGQMGEKTPNTAYGVEQFQNNASAVLRDFAREFDDNLITPHLRRYYHWLWQYGEDPDEKVDLNIVAKASTTLVERSLQNMQLPTLLTLAKEKQYRLDPAKVAEQALKAWRFVPKDFQYTDADWEAMGKDPVQEQELAKLRAETAYWNARGKHENAAAVETGVKSQYSAVQTGQVIAAVPEVAEVADEVLKGAGYKPSAEGVDPNLPQLAKPVETIEAMDLINPRTGMRTPQRQNNTDPRFPDKPDSPAVGAQAGIETPGNDGVRQ